MKNRTLLRILAVFICVLLALPVFASAENAPKKVTVMIYMCGTDLESNNGQATSSISEINATRFNSDEVNVIVLLGGCKRWSTGYANDSLTVLELGGRRPVIADSLPLSGMNDPATMTMYLDYCHEKYPAERYELVVWDHGGGPNVGVCVDQLFGSDTLSTMELAKALADSSFADRGLDSIIFHACLMASAEVATVLSPYAHYMVASEDAMYGLTYDWLNGIENDADGAVTGVKIVDQSFESNGATIARQNATELNSFALIDLSAMGRVNDALDGFYGNIAVNLDDAVFTTMSGGRRDSCAFGVGESGGNSDYDLVDLGDLTAHYAGMNPDGAAAVQEALDSAIIYHRGSTDGCTGLTVYHPYFNKKAMETRVSVYNGLGFSSGYTAYMQSFCAILTGTPLADWTGLKTEDSVDKAGRVGFTLQLSEDQFSHYGDSALNVVRENTDGTFTFAYQTKKTVISEKGKLSGEYSGTALYAIDPEGKVLTDALSYTVDEIGNYSIEAVGTWAETGEEQKVLLRYSQDETGNFSIDDVRVYDESAKGYTTIYNADIGSFSTMTFTVEHREPVEVSDGITAAFADWNVVSQESWTIDAAELKLGLIADSIDTSEMSATFQITDSQNNAYSGRLVSLNGSQADSDAITVSYDDAGLMTVANVNCLVNGGNVVMVMDVTNLTETEAFIRLQDLCIGGVAVEATAEAYGSGDNWGLVDGEAGQMFLQQDTAALNGIDSAEEITFNLVLIDSADETTVLGVVPVTLALQLSL